MASKGFVLYLLSGFSVAILSVLFVSDLSGFNPDHKRPSSPNSALLHSSSYGSSTDAVWPVCLSYSLPFRRVYMKIRIYAFVIVYTRALMILAYWVFFFGCRN
jgi:hypothetical protein